MSFGEKCLVEIVRNCAVVNHTWEILKWQGLSVLNLKCSSLGLKHSSSEDVLDVCPQETLRRLRY